MKSATDKGITIWQMLVQYFRGKEPEPIGRGTRQAEALKPTLPEVFNPLKFKVGGYVRVRSEDLDAHTFSVENIEEYVRQIGDTRLVFSDYTLFDPDGEVWVTVRVVPNDKDGYDCLLMQQHWQEKHSAELEAGIRKGVYNDEEKGLVYQSIAANKARVLEISAKGAKRREVEYWDFINEDGPETRFYIVEMDLSDRKGWIQAYRATVLSVEDVEAIAGHTSVAA